MTAWLKLFSFLALLENVISLDCNKPITPSVTNGKRINCELFGNQELSTIQCNQGFEFKPNISVLIIQTVDGVTSYPLSCNPVGCPKSEIPSLSAIETGSKYNMLLVRSECVPHITLGSICQPDVSFLDLECKPGFQLDPSFSSKRVKCNRNNLWSQIPVCIDLKQATISTSTSTTLTTTKITTNSSTTISSPPVVQANLSVNITMSPLQARALNQANVEPYTTSGPHIITVNTLTAPVTYSFPTNGLPCPNTFHLPYNYNETGMIFHIRKEPHAAYAHLNYHTGSYIIFPCLNGYKSSNPDGSPLVMSCQPDGKWSNIGNCISINPTTPDDDDDYYYYDDETETTTVSTTTEALLSFPVDPNGKGCPNVFRLPANYNNSNIKFHTKREPGTHIYFPGSYIVFSCAKGYRVFSSLPLYTYCQSDGTWSEVADCEDENSAPTTTTSTTTTTTALGTKPCPETFKVPTNYDSVATEYKIDRVKGTNTYQTGSWISFKCLPGFIPDSPAPLITYCLANGTWSYVGNCISTAPETTRRIRTTTQIPKSGCSKIFPRPTNINESRTVYQLSQDDSDPTRYKSGSWIKFECNRYYNVYTNMSLTSICNDNGDWSPVSDCKIHPCWERLPRRPLNGRREVELVYNPQTGSVKGSHVNFTCNTYYQIARGRDRVFCINGVWETDWPECRLSIPECTKEPMRYNTQNGVALKTLNRVQFRKEYSYERSEPAGSITHASYVCLTPGYVFNDMTDVGYRYINNMFYIYKNITCVGPERWSAMPVCVKN